MKVCFPSRVLPVSALQILNSVSLEMKEKKGVHVREDINGARDDPWTPPHKERSEQRLATNLFTDDLEGVINPIGIPRNMLAQGEGSERVRVLLTSYKIHPPGCLQVCWTSRDPTRVAPITSWRWRRRLLYGGRQLPPLRLT